MAPRSSARSALAPVGADAANSDYDNLNGVTLGDTPYTSVMPFVAPVQSFDNSTFGADQEYNTGAPTYGACQAWGWRSAWVRFATAVKGRVFVTVDSSAPPGYDVFYSVFTAPTSIPPGSASMSPAEPGGVPERQFRDAERGLHLRPRDRGEPDHLRPGHVRVREPHPSARVRRRREGGGAPGGPTSLSVRFTPYNGDNDGVADTLDECPGTPGAVRGCPDGDGDGVPDPADACPGTKGSRADGCRVPDEDGDHYNAGDPDPRLRDCNDDNPDVHPGVPEVRGNGVDENCDGLAAFDKDGDNWDDEPGPDCDPDQSRSIPHARDKPGNGVDENCDGHDARFPRVTSEVAPLYLASDGRTVGFARFKVLPVRKGDRVRIECVGGGCPVLGEDIRGPPLALRDGRRASSSSRTSSSAERA